MLSPGRILFLAFYQMFPTSMVGILFLVYMTFTFLLVIIFLMVHAEYLLIYFVYALQLFSLSPLIH